MTPWPHEMRREVEVRHRVEAHQGSAHRLLGYVDDNQLDVMLAAYAAAMRGWDIAAHREETVRWVVAP